MPASFRVLQLFFDDRKKDTATTTVHRKSTIDFLKQLNILSDDLSILWEDIDCCYDKYRCATVLYLMTMLSHSFSDIIDRGISAPGHGREVVDCLNATNNRFFGRKTCC